MFGAVDGLVTNASLIAGVGGGGAASCCGITRSRGTGSRSTSPLTWAAGSFESGGDERGSRFAFNCDIATPMRRRGTAVLAVDLFADVLVRADAVSHRVSDLDELDQASRNGLIVPQEARGAARGLAELTAIVERGDPLAFLSRACLTGPLEPPAAVPVGHVPLSRVPLLSLESRATWLRRAGIPGMPLSP